MIPSISGDKFINRDDELKLIKSALDALSDNKRLLRTPIIDFFGVDGIGKTRVLQEVRQRCLESGFSYIWVNANQSSVKFLSEWLQQLRQFHIDKDQNDIPDTAEALYIRSVHGMKSLLEKEPVVVLLDEIDSDSAEEVGWIETILYELINDANLFVVLASQQQISFDRYRSVARKLLSHRLKPFGQNACQSYLSDIAGTIDQPIREEIISWAHGFPLTMKVMSQIVQERKLDPRLPEDQKQLISSLMEQVVDHGIFARVAPDRLAWCKSYVNLLSMPRRFNLVILQRLIETFAPSLKLAGKLEYMGLPGQINQGTDVLYWDMGKSGFTIDETVRHLFFRQRAIEQPELFYNIHQFLADLNKQFANEVNGSDRIRYLREYLYHSTFVKDAQALPPLLEETAQEIAKESPDAFVQFSEELRQDEELKYELGEHLSIISNFVDKTLHEKENK